MCSHRIKLPFGLTIHPYSPKAEKLKAIFWLLLAFSLGNFIFRGVIIPLFSDQIDFKAYYDGAEAVKNHLPLYENLKTFFGKGILNYEGSMPYAYPPFFAILFVPFSFLDVETAGLIWRLVKLPLLLLGFLSCLAAIKKNYYAEEFILLVFMVVNFSPLLIDMLLGQSSLIIFLFFSLSWLYYKRKRYFLTGLFLALSTAIKLFPIFFLMFFIIKKEWKFIMTFSLSLVLLVGISISLVGLGSHMQYFRIVSGEHLMDSFHDNQSFLGFYSRLLTQTIWTRGVIDAPFLASILTIASFVILGVTALWKFKKNIKNIVELSDLEYSIMIIFMLLVAPLTQTHYLTLLLIPFCTMFIVFINDNCRCTLSSFLLFASYFILSSWYPLALEKFLSMKAFGIISHGFPAIFFSIQFLGIVLLFIAAVKQYDSMLVAAGNGVN